MKHFNLIKPILLLFALVVGGVSSAWAEGISGQIKFGNASGCTNVNSTSVSGNDSQGNTWTITTSGTSSFTPNAAYAQIGSSSKPATSITFTTTLTEDVNITSFSAKFGGFNSTAGDVTLKVGDTTVGTGSLNATNDVTISSTSSAIGKVLTVAVTGIAKGVKVYQINYTYEAAGSDPAINAINNVNIAYGATSGEFDYSISNPVDAQSLTASITSGSTWLSNPTVDAVNHKVTFTTTENEDEDNVREGTIHLVYGDNLATKDVTVTQAVAPKKYTVTFSDPVGGTLVVKNGDDNIISGSRFPVGTELTIVPTAAENYKFKDWQFKKGTGNWITRPNLNYTMDANDVEFRANFDPTYAVNWSVNGVVASVTRFAEGEDIEFPNDPEEIDGRVFVGWVADEISGTTDDEPSFLTAPVMGNSDITYYAVFATAGAAGAPMEKKTQILQHDTWTYSNGTGSTTDKNDYRMFGEGSYIESDPFDLSKLSKVIVYGGTYGGSTNNSLTIGDGENTWKDVTVSGSSQTGVNTYTNGTALSGINKLRITSNSGNGTSTGVRISKVEIYTNEPSVSYSDYCTTIAAVPSNETIIISAAGWATYCSSSALDFTGITDLTAYIASKDGDAVKFTKVEGKVPANEGLLVSGVTTNVPVCAIADPVENLLEGVTEEAMKTAGSIFVLMNGTNGIGFYKNANDFTLRANSAYLPAEVVEGAAARAFIGLDDVTTGIAEVKGQKAGAKRMFDLQGRKVANPAKGLYIVDGRKVVVK